MCLAMPCQGSNGQPATCQAEAPRSSTVWDPGPHCLAIGKPDRSWAREFLERFSWASMTVDRRPGHEKEELIELDSASTQKRWAQTFPAVSEYKQMFEVFLKYCNSSIDCVYLTFFPFLVDVAQWFPQFFFRNDGPLVQPFLRWP